MFNELINQIETAYRKFGYDLGWNFMYSPESTIEADMMLIGVNPGGNQYETPIIYTQNGIAWVDWNQEIRLLVERLGTSDILTTNFVFFRSPTWVKLPYKKEAIAFSTEFWRKLLPQLNLRVIICIGDLPFHHLRVIMFEFDKHRSWEMGKIGWGQANYIIEQIGETLLIRFPHFSRYHIMSSQKCRPQVDRIIEKIKEHRTCIADRR